MKNFYNRAMQKVQQIGERYRKMDELYREVCTMFSENPKNKEPEDFFGGIQILIDAYKFATKENEQRRKEEETLKKAQMLDNFREKYINES